MCLRPGPRGHTSGWTYSPLGLSAASGRLASADKKTIKTYFIVTSPSNMPAVLSYMMLRVSNEAWTALLTLRKTISLLFLVDSSMVLAVLLFASGSDAVHYVLIQNTKCLESKTTIIVNRLQKKLKKRGKRNLFPAHRE